MLGLYRASCRTMWCAVTLVGAVCWMASVSRAGDWPAFRGPQGDGTSSEPQFPLKWTADKNVKWKVDLPQPGNGSPIVSRGCVFVACAEDTQGRQRSLYCFDRRDGSLRWKQTVPFDRTMPTHKDNPYCGSTPAADGQRVVVWHASAGLYCYDYDGRELWSRDLGDFEHIWGYGTSPILYQDRVIMHCAPGKRNFVAALDLKTGRTLWESEEPHEGTGSEREDGKYMGSWTTPIVTQVDGRDQILCAMPTRLVAYDPQDGKIIWYCEGLRGSRGDLAYSSPVIVGDICVVTGGFSGPAIAVRYGGQGNVTSERRLWRNESNPQSIGSGVAHSGYLIRPNAGPGTIDCMDPSTGEILWRQRAGANMWGSIVLAGEHAYVTNQDGVTIVFRPSPQGCQIVAENPLGTPCNATPALSEGEIFIRTFPHLVCIAAQGDL